MKRGSIFLTLGVLMAIVLGLYTGFYYWQNSKVESETKVLDKNIAELSNQLLIYEEGEIEESIVAKQKLDELKAETIIWSEVIKEVQRTVPTKKGKTIINILSYSGSGNNNISLSLETKGSADNPYFDVADFIRAFDDSSYFIEGFVPSLAVTADDEGNQVITFNYSGNFVFEDLESVDLSDSVIEVVPPEESKIEEEVDEDLEDLLRTVEEEETDESEEESVEEPLEEDEETIDEVLTDILEESLETDTPAEGTVTTEEVPGEEDGTVLR